MAPLPRKHYSIEVTLKTELGSWLDTFTVYVEATSIDDARCLVGHTLMSAYDNSEGPKE